VTAFLIEEFSQNLSMTPMECEIKSLASIFYDISSVITINFKGHVITTPCLIRLALLSEKNFIFQLM
jgi:hypothetical protein